MSESLLELSEGRFWERAAPWLLGVGVSVILFVGVFLSGRSSTEAPEPEMARSVEAVVLPPPPPVQQEKPVDRSPRSTPVKIDFHSMPSEERVALLDVRIAPQKDVKLLERLTLDLASFEVTMDDVDDLFVFDQSEVDKAPAAISQPFPEVPRKLKGNGDQKVRVMFYVDEEGRVAKPYVIESTNPELNEIVLEAVLRWKYSPARKDGRRVRCWGRTTVHFAPPKSAFSL